MRYFLILGLFWMYGSTVSAQTLGGNAAFGFLQLPFSSQQSALGGINISTQSNDVANGWANPALLKPSMHRQLSTAYNAFLAGINQHGLMGAINLNNTSTTVGVGLHYIGYGTVQQTDAAGNNLGFFTASDYSAQLLFSAQYMQAFRLGGAVKFVQSNYGQYRSSAAAVDIGLNYVDTTKGLQLAFVVKNIGFQLRSYAENGKKEELPFDVQLGVSKKFESTPLELSLTAQQAHRFNINYADTAAANETGLAAPANNFGSKLLSHLIIAARYTIDDYIELNMGYNFLRARDLSVSGGANALNGFNGGVAILFRKMGVRYSTGFYQKNLYHHFSLNFSL